MLVDDLVKSFVFKGLENVLVACQVDDARLTPMILFNLVAGRREDGVPIPMVVVPVQVAPNILCSQPAVLLDAYMTSITFFELCRGARLSPEPERSPRQVKFLQAYINVLPFDEKNAEEASEIYVYLEKRGEPLEIRDVFIGASVRTYRIPLATRNTAHFERIPGVQVITPHSLISQL
jgi:tRNA(fMet)-specific endonuclease VapC